MNNYKVIWDIDLKANSPEEAAKEALDCIINGTARIFEVVEETSSKYTALGTEPVITETHSFVDLCLLEEVNKNQLELDI